MYEINIPNKQKPPIVLHTNPPTGFSCGLLENKGLYTMYVMTPEGDG